MVYVVSVQESQFVPKSKVKRKQNFEVLTNENVKVIECTEISCMKFRANFYFKIY